MKTYHYPIADNPDDCYICNDSDEEYDGHSPVCEGHHDALRKEALRCERERRNIMKAYGFIKN